MIVGGCCGGCGWGCEFGWRSGGHCSLQDLLDFVGASVFADPDSEWPAAALPDCRQQSEYHP
jgi:hypothetical protein